MNLLVGHKIKLKNNCEYEQLSLYNESDKNESKD